MREQLTFRCHGDTLAATLDHAPGSTGLFIVSGGNEVRAGAHRGMAMLAADVAAAGYPVWRFDRRGVGDSDGENREYRSSADDCAGAMAAFRARCPAMRRVVAFGNCDAASALLLHAPPGIDALVLANPWTIDDGAGFGNAPALPPPAAIRSRYAARLADPATFVRLLRGQISLSKLARGVRAALSPAPATQSGLAAEIGGALGGTQLPITILLARRDRTAQAFAAAWDGPAFAAARARAKIERRWLDSATHSFSGDDGRWLRDELLRVLHDQASKSA